MALDPVERLAQLGIVLPDQLPPMGAYRPYVRDAGIIFLSGVAPREGNAYAFIGQVGANLSLEEAKAAARLCAIGLLANLQHACDGELRRVRKILMVRGYVSAAPAFTDIPSVTNAASALLVNVFGEEVGAHARTSIGCSSLPGGVAVELDAQVSIL